MQKQLWRSRAIRSNRQANIGLASRCSMRRRAKESSMCTIVQDWVFPHKSLGIIATYVIKLGELDFLQHSLLNGCEIFEVS